MPIRRGPNRIGWLRCTLRCILLRMHLPTCEFFRYTSLLCQYQSIDSIITILDVLKRYVSPPFDDFQNNHETSFYTTCHSPDRSRAFSGLSDHQLVSIRALWAVEVPSNCLLSASIVGSPASRGQNLGRAQPAHFVQGHTHVRPLVRTNWIFALDVQFALEVICSIETFVRTIFGVLTRYVNQQCDGFPTMGKRRQQSTAEKHRWVKPWPVICMEPSNFRNRVRSNDRHFNCVD
jgi:hypothetical protein